MKVQTSELHSLIESCVSEHPDVNLVDNGNGAADYVLNQSVALVRHADRLDCTAEWKEHPDSQTWPNDTPLSQAGHSRAEEVGQAIKASGKSFSLIIASPYLRCAQTACGIAKVLKCPILFDLDFGEVFDSSSLVGKVSGPQHRDSDTLAAMLREDFPTTRWIQDGGKLKITGTQQVFPESLEQARLRFCFKAQQVLQKAASELMSIVIVTHGDAVGSVLGMMKKDWKVLNVPYASFAIASRQVAVLEKESVDVKSDEDIYKHDWTVTLSELPSLRIKSEEIHPFSRKNHYARLRYDARKMESNPKELDTDYFDLDQPACLQMLERSASDNKENVQQAFLAKSLKYRANDPQARGLNSFVHGKLGKYILVV
jgi:broad specificity phosphatase PhoE